MLIHLLRHGDASSDSRYHDSERPLTELGVKQAAFVGKYFQSNSIRIDTIYASPLTRAQQTADIVRSHIGGPAVLTTEYLVNGTNQRQLFSQLEQINSSSVLLVGHIPHLAETAMLLMGDNTEELDFRKCTLASIDIPLPIRSGMGILKRHMHVKEIEAQYS